MSGPKKLGWARPGSNASNTPSAIPNEDRFGARKEMKTENSDSVPKSEKPGSDEDMPKITFMSKAQRAKRDRPKSPEKVKTEKKDSDDDDFAPALPKNFRPDSSKARLLFIYKLSVVQFIWRNNKNTKFIIIVSFFS